MKCPYCGSDLYEGAKFCNVCGNQVVVFYPPAAVKKKPKGEKIAVALLKSVCFIVYFMGIQSIITAAYMFSIYYKNPHLLMSSSSDLMETAAELLMLMGENIHEMLIISGLLTILILGLVYRLRGKKMHEEIRLNKTSPVLLVKVAVCAVAMQFFTVILISMIPFPESMFDSLENSSGLLMGGSLAMQIINIAILTPIVEEIIFRGFIYTRLRKALSVLPSVLISGMIFGVVHGSIIGFLYASALGFFMAMLMERFDSIIPCMVCHIFFNGASLSTALFPDNNIIVLTIFAVSAVTTAFFLYWIFKGTSNKKKHDFDKDNDNYTTDV